MRVFSVEPGGDRVANASNLFRNLAGVPERVVRPKKRRTLTASQLKERGWTEGLIRSVLGAPDKRRKNPNYRSAAPLRLYFLGRVLDAEQQPSVRARAPAAHRRVASAAVRHGERSSRPFPPEKPSPSRSRQPLTTSTGRHCQSPFYCVTISTA